MPGRHEAARADGCSHEKADGRVADSSSAGELDAGALQHRSRRLPVVAPPPAVPSSRFPGPRRIVRVRRASAAPATAPCAAHHPDNGAGHRRDDGALQRDLRRADEAAALAERRSDRRLEGDTWRQSRRASATSPTPPTSRGATKRRRSRTSRHGRSVSSRSRARRARTHPDHGGHRHAFPVLGARPLVGSFFEQKDETSPVIVLSEGLWRQRFGADPAVLGHPCNSMASPTPSSAYCRTASRIRIGSPAPSSRSRSAGGWQPPVDVQRDRALRPGVTAAQAAVEGTARGRLAADTGMTTMAIFGSNGPSGSRRKPSREALTADVRRPLIVLLVAVGLLLATATANVASLQLARTTTRSRGRWRFAPRSGPAARA